MAALERISELDELYTNGRARNVNEVVSIECLLDMLLLLHEECCESTQRRERNFSEFVSLMRAVVERIHALRLRKDDFETLKIIGRGAFGEVHVVRLKGTSNIYALKSLNKWEMLRRQETACFREERDVLVFGDRDWITSLQYAFQDENYLYLVMEYYSGGDLLTLLSKYEDRLPEEMAKFYLAEMVLCIDSVHKLGYVHRDIKPDNFVINRYGHLRLADFGSCMRLREDETVQSSVAVGTPDYISPEILRAMEDGQGCYGVECDWWSLGVCMYEMLFGETPFYAESLVDTYGKIMNFKNSFQFPDDVDEEEVSPLARDVMKSLCCEKEKRLGQNGANDLKTHPFFEGIDWESLRKLTPPYVPEIADDADTSNFDHIEEQRTTDLPTAPSGPATFKGHHLPFVGFTFTNNSCLSDLASLGGTSQKETIQRDGKQAALTDNSELKKEMDVLRKQNTDLKQQLNDAVSATTFSKSATPTCNGLDVTPYPTSPNEVLASKSDDAKELGLLKAEVEELRKKLEDVNQLKNESDTRLKDYEKQQEEMTSNFEEVSRKVKLMEKTNKSAQQEKQDLDKEVEELQSKLASQHKDLKDVQAQRRQIAAELSDSTDKLSDARDQKLKLQKMIREKEEEIEDLMAKVDSLRQENRSSDKKRRELQVQLEDSQSELLREKRAHQRIEQQAQQLDKEVSALKAKQPAVRSVSSPDRELQVEVKRLKASQQQLRDDCDETVRNQSVKHSAETAALNDQLQHAEGQVQNFQKEVQELQTKLVKLKRKRCVGRVVVVRG
ncbi:serine/threonine-protein kinase MRCK alpha-like [Corticium candelabrum]|uniref:serine/threonine-protein kinase MRCK alpha-like n=1 Tax=Corticium candelabrum TaxID=121492 RepID=UPI002E264C8F|nr:serine/threonine-protein kinase MRCK alpha-like [Corticium candelabrum]